MKSIRDHKFRDHMKECPIINDDDDIDEKSIPSGLLALWREEKKADRPHPPQPRYS
jgi:hypothetical protein